MKASISLPENVVETAEALAESLGVSLSDLSEALVAHCQKHGQPQKPSKDLHEFYAEASSQLDPVIAQMQFASIPYEEW
jgi:hypothetical protein